MKPAVVAFICLLSVTLSCKKTKDEGRLCFSRTSTGLKIANRTNKEFHFIAFSQSVSPLIDWIPTCRDNEIAANDSISRDLSGTFGYSDSLGLVVYWWKCTNNNPGEIQFVVLDKEQTICR